jgi:hypothetical protein
MSPALLLCLLSFAFCYWAGRRALTSGLVAVLGVGYAYGITRANVPETYSHFIFDAGVVGLYASQLFRRLSLLEKFKVGNLRPWLEFLVAWPLLLFLIPIQDLLIQFVGLRGNIFLLPFILFGARLDADNRYRLALWIAGFNLMAFVFAGTEYFIGIERFFPHNHVTELIYTSHDLVGHTAYRIPATFVNAHAYGGTMAMGLPLLLGAAIQRHKSNLQFQWLVLGIVAALVGVLMSAARTQFLVAAALIIVTMFALRSKVSHAVGWLILLGGIGWMVSGEQRLQRFMELRDTDYVAERIATSVNMNFIEIAAKYPMGNGLGGGGSSIPYFLQGRIVNPVAMENEYARIMLEQGIPGLLIWMAFIVWLLARRDQDRHDSWYLGRRLAKVACAMLFVVGLTGIGLLTSIPQTSLFLLLVGWVGARQPRTELAVAAPRFSGIESQAPAQQYG